MRDHACWSLEGSVQSLDQTLWTWSCLVVSRVCGQQWCSHYDQTNCGSKFFGKIFSFVNERTVWSFWKPRLLRILVLILYDLLFSRALFHRNQNIDRKNIYRFLLCCHTVQFPALVLEPSMPWRRGVVAKYTKLPLTARWVVENATCILAMNI